MPHARWDIGSVRKQVADSASPGTLHGASAALFSSSRYLVIEPNGMGSARNPTQFTQTRF